MIDILDIPGEYTTVIALSNARVIECRALSDIQEIEGYVKSSSFLSRLQNPRTHSCCVIYLIKERYR